MQINAQVINVTLKRRAIIAELTAKPKYAYSNYNYDLTTHTRIANHLNRFLSIFSL